MMPGIRAQDGKYFKPSQMDHSMLGKKATSWIQGIPATVMPALPGHQMTTLRVIFAEKMNNHAIKAQRFFVQHKSLAIFINY